MRIAKTICTHAAIAAVILSVFGLTDRSWSSDKQRIESLQQEFQAYTGARLVFSPGDLPPGNYYDKLPLLAESRQLKAAEILLQEAHKYPRGYLGKVGMKAFGVFSACVSTANDGFHPYVADLGGYRYYGMWNGADGVAAAYYTDEQLPLTFHHELFHQIQVTQRGETNHGTYAHDQMVRYHQAISGQKPYPAPVIRPDDVAALKRATHGNVLQNALGKYASKNDQEDQAETARYFMTNLADALVQTVESPKLPGSQRILHGLQLYREAGSPGPGIDWFVDLSLKRAPRATISTNPYLEKVDKAINDPDARAAIRRVQPACVRLSNGSGCCVSRKGQILTAAHVAGQVGQLLKVTFPDGQSHWAKCSALDAHLDLALLQINDNGEYPFAPVAHAPPEADTWVCVIGQPGSTTPSGRATNYQPFHVSVGKIRGFKEDDRLALQTLGGTKHDAWTYWGHSGSPLFNKQGEIVAMHNSWDSTTAMRHAVTYEAIVKFLRDSGVNTVALR